MDDEMATATPPSPARVKRQKDGFVATIQPRSTYLTTQQLADELAAEFRADVYPETVWRWCRKWFGKLPSWRSHPKLGYRIPLSYRLVARAWMQTKDAAIREAVIKPILDQPREWVVVVSGGHVAVGGNESEGRGVVTTATTHYSVGEMLRRVEILTPWASKNHQLIHVINVGPIKMETEGHG